ncbi:MAG: pseudouridine synthase [Eubacteriales bacterium]
MRTFTINKNDAGQRLDKFVTKATSGLPKSLLYKYIRTKRIKLNSKKAHENEFLSEGDIVEMYIPDEFFGESGAENNSLQAYSKVKFVPEIVYEDENILLCDKKPGMLVHLGDEGDKNRAEGSERETLIYLLTAYLANKGEYDPMSEASFAPALCNRIDRNTGGIVILAKNAEALRLINEAIRENRVHKKYLCAVHGRLEGEKTLTAYHKKDCKTNTVKIFDRETAGAKKIITQYTAFGYNRELDLTLVEINLITGRTHQIRAHMAHIGHPLLGEGKYAHNAGDRKMGYSCQALYSYSVSFELGGALGYLNGKEYTVDKARIPFLSLFE